MKTLMMIGIVSLTMLAPLAAGQDDCVVTSADPATIYAVDLTAVGGSLYYNEERDGLFVAGILVPQSGFFLGEGSWTYEESNEVSGLQRGGIGLTGAWFPPGCDQNPDWEPTDATVPCLIIDEDPINDETCGAGPDTLIW